MKKLIILIVLGALNVSVLIGKIYSQSVRIVDTNKVCFTLKEGMTMIDWAENANNELFVLKKLDEDRKKLINFMGDQLKMRKESGLEQAKLIDDLINEKNNMQFQNTRLNAELEHERMKHTKRANTIKILGIAVGASLAINAILLFN